MNPIPRLFQSAAEFSVAIVAALAAAGAADAALPSYTVSEVPPLDDAGGIPYSTQIVALNDNGAYVVSRSENGTHTRSQICRAGRCKLLPQFAKHGAKGGSSHAMDIDAAGNVAGTARNGQVAQGFYIGMPGRVLTGIGELTGEGVSSSAYGMNNLGEVVGRYDIDGWTAPPYVWKQGVITLLPTLSGTDVIGEALQINDAGQIVGWSYVVLSGIGGRRATLWTDGVPQDLGAFSPDGSSTATDINESGVITGCAVETVSQIPFVYRNGVMSKLGPFGPNAIGCGTSINDAGWIVGYVFDPQHYPFVWDGTQTFNANALLSPQDAAQYEVTSVVDINNLGEIAVGLRRKVDGSYNAGILHPVAITGH